MTAGEPDHRPFVLLVGGHTTDISQEVRLRVPGARQWHLLSVATPADVPRQPTHGMPDLVVLHLDEHLDDVDALFEHAKAEWPLTFFMLASHTPRESLQPLYQRHGDMPLALPDATTLCTAIGHEVAGLSHGSMRGLSLPSLLQMMEWEAKSLAIRVQAGPCWGRLHLFKGRLVDAYVHGGPSAGEDAAYQILAWPNVAMTLERSYRNLHHTIEQPLANLLMEAMRRQDETHNQEGFSIEDLLLDDAAEDDLLVGNSRSRRQAHTPAPPSAEPPVHVVDITPSPLTSAEVPSAIKEHTDMANAKETLDAALQTIDGAAAAALVDYSSGMALGTAGSGVNLEVAAAGNTEVVRAKLRTMDALGIKGGIEDILITLEKQYHIIYLIPGQTLFLYLVLNRDQANLAMARYKLKALGSDIKI